jgi:hypothetical protein
VLLNMGTSEGNKLDKGRWGRIDPLLVPLLSSAGEDASRKYLSELIAAHAEPVVRGIIWHKLRFSSTNGAGQADAEDILQETLLQLVIALQRFQEKPEEHPINDLPGLAAAIARCVCSLWMRRHYPGRYAFKNRLYHLLRHKSSFALWKDAHKRLVVGFSAWQGQKTTASRERLEKLWDEDNFVARIRTLMPGKQSADLAVTLSAIFEHLGGPVELDHLVNALFRGVMITGQSVHESVYRALALEGPDQALQVERRSCLKRLWEEVQLLPRHQRVALLLNLKDRSGSGCIELLMATGVASFYQLAEILGISVERFADLWNDLPLQDACTAELLQVSRQQVINARKSARERLSRKLKGCC